MTPIDVIKRYEAFLNEGGRLSVSAQALMLTLVTYWNENRRPDLFELRNGAICEMTGISQNTLRTARLELMRHGLVYVVKGENDLAPILYGFEDPEPGKPSGTFRNYSCETYEYPLKDPLKDPLKICGDTHYIRGCCKTPEIKCTEN